MPALDGATEWLNCEPLGPCRAARPRRPRELLDAHVRINWLRQEPYVLAWSRAYRDDGCVVIGVHREIPTPTVQTDHRAFNLARGLHQCVPSSVRARCTRGALGRRRGRRRPGGGGQSTGDPASFHPADAPQAPSHDFLPSPLNVPPTAFAWKEASAAGAPRRLGWTTTRRPPGRDRRPRRSRIREKQQRRADCSYPCQAAATQPPG